MNIRKLINPGMGILLALTAIVTAPFAMAFTSSHTFSVDDVMGGFNGSTFGPHGAVQDTSIICGIPGGATCSESTAQPFVDKQGVTLYPVDSEFGFYPVDFLGAVEKSRDGDYMEGFVGNITDGGEVIGIKISNQETDTYKVKAPMGTWCRGVGGNSVKCETEHYTVMEHILSCHEVIPYFNADPITGEQAIISLPDGSASFDCALAGLDDEALILVDGKPSRRLTDPTPGVQMDPNDKTDTQNNVAVTSDYSVQLKDDGKVLYG